MATPLQLDQLAAACGQPGVAVLFPDTCALLDIVRLPIRCDAAQIRRELAAIDRVIENATSSPPRLTILIAPPIVSEWKENIEKVLSETDKAAKQWLAHGEQFAEIQGYSTYSANVRACNSFLSAGASLRSLAESILASSIEIERDDAAMARAMLRISLAQAPARKGEQAKDCMIIEHVLAAAGRLNSTSRSQTPVFLSSNTADYCEMKSTLRQPLRTEFPRAGLQFAAQWEWARSLLGV
jgi:hypothetical protein